MKTPLQLNTGWSSFRFSLHSLRSPVSPLTPRAAKATQPKGHFPGGQSNSESSSPTVRGSPIPEEKEPAGVAVTVVDSDNVNAVRAPNALPNPIFSPITPWHASFHRNAAGTSHETVYLRQTGHLRYARIILSLFILATGATLTALESDVFSRYQRSHLPSAFHLSLWPTDLNLKPTILLLVNGIVATFLALITIIVSVIPSPNPRTKLNNLLFTLLCVITGPFTLATLIFSSIISPNAIFSSFISDTLTSLVTTTGPSNTVGLTPNGQGDNPKRETIQSFTCAIANTAKAFNTDATSLKLPSVSDTNNLVPSGFGRICTETRAGLAITVALLGLAGIGAFVAVASWIMERRIERLRGEREVIGSRHGSRDGKANGRDVPESLVGMRYEEHQAV